jgi:hypothetical protein
MTQYDYKNQAWMKDGRYLDCSHPDAMDCQCYGRKYEGLTVEQATYWKNKNTDSISFDSWIDFYRLEVKSADAELSTEHTAIRGAN